MKISLEATGTFEHFNAVKCRLWKGKTESGTEIVAYIPCLRASAAAAQVDLERELTEIKVARQLTHFDARIL